jgi:signal transduction histidine kinase
MNSPTTNFQQLYQDALLSHLAQKSRSQPDPQVVGKILKEVLSGGISMRNFTKLHEHLLVTVILANLPTQKQTSLIRHAGNFFAATITAVGAAKGNEGARESALLKKTIKTLSVRTVELANTNRKLALEISQRKKAETKARKSERKLLESLEKSETLKEQLRNLSRQILIVQEEERKNISRELHDVVAQALLGINVRLATLKAKAGIDSKGLLRNITLTQKMVKESVDIVHQYVCELRPAVLDDLGLIPALQSFMKSFTTRTGVLTYLTAFKELEQLHTVKLTILYRVAQEAFTNVARHAQASEVRDHGSDRQWMLISGSGGFVSTRI